MTTHQQHELDRQQARYATRDTAEQARREAEAGETAWTCWEVLFRGGEYRRAAQQWREIIHPTLDQTH